jgi:hypothetical protein
MAAARPSLLRLAEGLALACLGGVMLWLPLAGNYWYFLHPRFKPLTGGAGGLLLLFGLFAALAGGRPRLRRLLAAGGSVALILGAYLASLPPAPAAGPAAEPFTESAPAAPDPRVEHAGHSYLRLNLAELQTLTATGRPSGRVAVRGVVRRTPEMDRAGEFALLRPVVVCCLADTVAAGYVVLAPGELPADGAWTEVLGETRPAGRPLDPQVSLPGVLALAVDPERLLAGHLARPAPAPEIPFIFTISEGEPYTW